jgi:uncharacterized metal-binding protein YceD (DUF177 family)
MTAEQLKIFTEQLKGDRREKLDASLSPDCLDLHEKEITVPSPIVVQGEAYVVDDLLMLSLSVKTAVEMPCSICNAAVRVSIQNKDIFISIPLSELPSTIFDCSALVREEVLMLLPQFVECKEGACPERQTLKSYLKTGKKEETQNFPFADLH